MAGRHPVPTKCSIISDCSSIRVAEEVAAIVGSDRFRHHPDMPLSIRMMTANDIP